MSIITRTEAATVQSTSESLLYTKQLKDKESMIFTLLCEPEIAFKDEVWQDKKLVYQNYIKAVTNDKPTITEHLDVPNAFDATKKRQYKKVWVSFIYNHTNDTIQIWEFSHSDIIKPLLALDDEYNLLETPIKVTRDGEKTLTSYSLIPVSVSKNPINVEKITEQIDKYMPDISNIYSGKSVFAKV